MLHLCFGVIVILLYIYIELIQLMIVTQQILVRIHPFIDQCFKQAFRVSIILAAVMAIFGNVAVIIILLYIYIELIQLMAVMQQILERINPFLDQFFKQALRVSMILIAVMAIFGYFNNRSSANDPDLHVDSKYQPLN